MHEMMSLAGDPRLLDRARRNSSLVFLFSSLAEMSVQREKQSTHLRDPSIVVPPKTSNRFLSP